MSGIISSINRYLSNNLVDCAYKLSRFVYNQTPTPDLRLLYGQCLYRTHRYDECRVLLSPMTQTEQTVNLLSLCCIETKNYATGISSLSQYILSHQFPILYFLLGEMHFALFHRNEALKCYQLALSLDSNLLSAHLRVIELGEPIYKSVVSKKSTTTPSDTFPRRRLFQSEISSQQTDNNSLELLNVLLQLTSVVEKCDSVSSSKLIKGDFACCLMTLDGMALAAQITFHEHNYPVTVAICREAIKKYPQANLIYPIYAETLYLTKNAKELHALAMKAANNKCLKENWTTLGFEALLLNKTEDAVKCFEKAQDLEKSVFNVVCLGKSLMEDKQQEDALKCFRSAVTLNPKSVTGWCYIAKASLSLKMMDEALKAGETAISIETTVDSLMVNVIILMKVKDFEKALKYLEELLKMNKSVEIELRHVAVLDALGKPKEAFEEVKKLREKNMNEVLVRIVYARILKKMGLSQLAIEEYTTLKSMFPKSASAIQNEMDRLGKGNIGEEVIVFPEWIGY
ncbi:anaphase promoting complex subunit, putative [Entamoeba invadens IP1]|uniref:anaphase promoting complex subunit, putative n=1 Tax=Entamoeba invadens IP1 TaxID=370355 RepID=UPI0002C3D9F2|nr:anaphase promoting complex subunit, putative [Entamoeba invadens IP1]ELP93881.1 anaphase promoting complex subunit, putative [Entamoeba invadens IP1]|eukprot:XP_004260652.1 anaphase promoting complex subunit, putative [Entamoeba invadens IP1]